MSAKITDVSNGILTCEIGGILKRSEADTVQEQAGRIIARSGDKVRFLVILKDFQELEKEADWSDVSFAARHDASIEKIAVVGDETFRSAAYLFMGKGVRKVAIEYFSTATLNEAKAWLATPATAPNH